MRARSRSDEADARLSAVLSRDHAADGAFVFAVRSTGIYCRPGCPARRPRRENIVMFDNPAGARAAGYRACLRCHPDRHAGTDSHAEVVARVCRLVGESETPPDLDALAAEAGMSRFHFHRVFKSRLGVTPKQYIAARREGALREALPGAASVTAAIYDAGYQTPARFYADAAAILGMRPADYRAGGRNQSVWYACGDSALGRVLVAGTGLGLCAIFLGDSDDELRATLERRFANARLVAADAGMAEWVAQTIAHIEAPKGAFALPLDVRGTAFQQKVWRALRDIPWGETAAYAEIARRIGSSAATRAVAGACGANPAAVAVPCHRVVRSDGGLGGYRWGLERKRALLRREQEED